LFHACSGGDKVLLCRKQVRSEVMAIMACTSGGLRRSTRFVAVMKALVTAAFLRLTLMAPTELGWPLLLSRALVA
jgi:hypothetical protein